MAEILRLKNGVKECIVWISARAFQRVFTCKNRSRYSRKRATFCRKFADRPSCRRPVSAPEDVAANTRAFHLLQGRRQAFLRSEVNIELNFPPKLRGARSRLYRRRFLQVNTRWKALAEIYTMHSFAPFSNLNFFVKNRQNFFAIELMNIH